MNKDVGEWIRGSVSHGLAAIKGLPYRHMAVGSGILGMSSIIYASGRDYIHEQAIYFDQLTCYPRIMGGAKCELRLLLDGITSTFGIKRINVQLQSAHRHHLLVNQPILPLLKHAGAPVDFPFIPVAQVHCPFALPMVQGEHRLVVSVHWPFQKGVRSQSPIFEINK